MIAGEETVLTITVALLSSLLIFGRTPKCLIQEFDIFLVLALKRRFFICYLAVQKPILGHYQKDSLNHPMLIIALLSFFDSKIIGNLITVSFKNIEIDCKQTNSHKLTDT